MRRRQWHPTQVLLPGKSHGRRSLVGCSPWGREESDTTERLHFHALEKEMATRSSVLAWRIPGDGGACAAVYGVAQSRTRLKRLSSSSSSKATWFCAMFCRHDASGAMVLFLQFSCPSSLRRNSSFFMSDQVVSN